MADQDDFLVQWPRGVTQAPEEKRLDRTGSPTSLREVEAVRQEFD